MQNTPVTYGPIAVTNAVTNMLNPATTTGGVNNPVSKTYMILTHVRAVNKTSSSHTISAWIGATGASAAGTEFAWSATVVPANSFLDWYGRVRLDTSQFLTAQADANTSIVLNAEGEVGTVI